MNPSPYAEKIRHRATKWAEGVAALTEVRELVEARGGRREQYDIAGLCIAARVRERTGEVIVACVRASGRV